MISSGSGTAGSGTATGAVEESLTLGEANSVTRGRAGAGGLSTLDGEAGVAVDPTAEPGRCGRAGERVRPGSGEACGSLCAEPETMSARPGASITDARRSGPPTSGAEGEAEPTPNSTIALYRTADATVAERPSLNSPLCLASPINPLSG